MGPFGHLVTVDTRYVSDKYETNMKYYYFIIFIVHSVAVITPALRAESLGFNSQRNSQHLLLTQDFPKSNIPLWFNLILLFYYYKDRF